MIQKFADARTTLERALELAPTRSATWGNLGEAYAGLGDEPAAIAALRLAYQFSRNREKTIAYFTLLTEKPDASPMLISAAKEARADPYLVAGSRRERVAEEIGQASYSLSSPSITKGIEAARRVEAKPEASTQREGRAPGYSSQRDDAGVGIGGLAGTSSQWVTIALAACLLVALTYIATNYLVKRQLAAAARTALPLGGHSLPTESAVLPRAPAIVEESAAQSASAKRRLVVADSGPPHATDQGNAIDIAPHARAGGDASRVVLPSRSSAADGGLKAGGKIVETISLAGDLGSRLVRLVVAGAVVGGIAWWHYGPIFAAQEAVRLKLADPSAKFRNVTTIKKSDNSVSVCGEVSVKDSRLEDIPSHLRPRDFHFFLPFHARVPAFPHPFRPNQVVATVVQHGSTMVDALDIGVNCLGKF